VLGRGAPFPLCFFCADIEKAVRTGAGLKAGSLKRARPSAAENGQFHPSGVAKHRQQRGFGARALSLALSPCFSTFLQPLWSISPWHDRRPPRVPLFSVPDTCWCTALSEEPAASYRTSCAFPSAGTNASVGISDRLRPPRRLGLDWLGFRSKARPERVGNPPSPPRNGCPLGVASCQALCLDASPVRAAHIVRGLG